MKYKSDKQRKAICASIKKDVTTKPQVRLLEIQERKIVGCGSIEKRIGDIAIIAKGCVSMESRKRRIE